MRVMWKQGARVSAPAEKAYEVLESVREQNGGQIVLQDVVEASRPKDAPLHGEFEWNNKRAAEKYRLEQARYIVRSLEVVRDEAPKAQGRVYEASYEQAEDEPEAPTRTVYRTTEDILRDPDLRDELLARAVRDAMAFRRRYRHLAELAQVFSAMDEFLTEADAA